MPQPEQADPNVSLAATQYLIDELIDRHDMTIVIGFKKGNDRQTEMLVRMGSPHNEDRKVDPRAILILMGKAQVAIAAGMIDPTE